MIGCFWLSSIGLWGTYCTPQPECSSVRNCSQQLIRLPSSVSQKSTMKGDYLRAWSLPAQTTTILEWEKNLVVTFRRFLSSSVKADPDKSWQSRRDKELVVERIYKVQSGSDFQANLPRSTLGDSPHKYTNDEAVKRDIQAEYHRLKDSFVELHESLASILRILSLLSLLQLRAAQGPFN